MDFRISCAMCDEKQFDDALVLQTAMAKKGIRTAAHSFSIELAARCMMKNSSNMLLRLLNLMAYGDLTV